MEVRWPRAGREGRVQWSLHGPHSIPPPPMAGSSAGRATIQAQRLTEGLSQRTAVGSPSMWSTVWGPGSGRQLQTQMLKSSQFMPSSWPEGMPPISLGRHLRFYSQLAEIRKSELADAFREHGVPAWAVSHSPSHVVTFILKTL